jgi:hypothetical protein
VILGASAISQLIQAAVCFALGAACGALWLFLDKVPMIKILRIASDMLLCLIFTACLLVILQFLNRGEVLIFHPAVALFGFFAARKILPRFVPYLLPSPAPKIYVSKGVLKKRIEKIQGAAKGALDKLNGKIKTALQKSLKPQKRTNKNERVLYEDTIDFPRDNGGAKLLSKLKKAGHVKQPN